MSDILEAVILRVLLDHQHVIGDEADLPQILNVNHLHTVLTVQPVKYPEEFGLGEIVHLEFIPYNVDGLSKNSHTVLSVGFLCQRVIVFLVCPVVEVREQAPVIMLHRKHEQHVQGKQA